MKVIKNIFFIIVFLISGRIYGGLATGNFNYINDLVGDRAMGLGGAYAAISDDPSGAYYNPAGIAFAFDNQISLSVNTFKAKQIVFENAVFTQNNYNQKFESFYPSFFGVIQSIGKLKVALVFVNINNEILDQDDRYKNIQIPESTATTGFVTANTYINYNNTDNTFLGGLSTGFFLNDKISLGFSAFVLNRKRQQIFNQMNEVVSPNGAAYNVGDVFITNVYQTDEFWGALFKAGMQWMPWEKIAFGLTVGGGTFFTHSNQSQDLTNGVISTSDGLVTGSALPIEVRAGVAFFASSRFLITADAIADFGTTYYETPVQNTINAAIGTEIYLTEMLPFRLGFFTNFANTPKMDPSIPRQDMHVDLYGISSSISLESRHSAITLSGFFQYGEGQSEIGTNANVTEKAVVYMYQIALTGTAKY